MPVAGRIGIVVTQLAGWGVMGHHRIHGTGRDGKAESRAPKPHEGLLGTPVGLGNDTDPVTVLFKPTGQERHAKSRVVDVGIATDEDDVQLTPAAPCNIILGYGYIRHGTLSR